MNIEENYSQSLLELIEELDSSLENMREIKINYPRNILRQLEEIIRVISETKFNRRYNLVVGREKKNLISYSQKIKDLELRLSSDLNSKDEMAVENRHDLKVEWLASIDVPIRRSLTSIANIIKT